MARVAAILGVRNGAATVGAAVGSLLAQTWRDLEVVVVDDGSTDATLSVLSAIADRRLRILPATGSGLTPALQQGLAETDSEFVARLDADDLARPDRLARQLEFLLARPRVAVVGSAAQFVDARGANCGRSAPPCEPSELARVLPRRNRIHHPTVVMRRAAIEAVGSYRTSFRLAQDYDLWLRCLERHELANLPEPLTWYRIHAGSLSVARQRTQAAYADLARTAWHRRQRGLPEGLADAAAVIEQADRRAASCPAELARVLSQLALRGGRRLVAVGHAARALALQPWAARGWTTLVASLMLPAGPRP
jgi:glycosyltransferase involved in cell wall biosynthesis